MAEQVPDQRGEALVSFLRRWGGRAVVLGAVFLAAGALKRAFPQSPDDWGGYSEVAGAGLVGAGGAMKIGAMMLRSRLDRFAPLQRGWWSNPGFLRRVELGVLAMGFVTWAMSLMAGGLQLVPLSWAGGGCIAGSAMIVSAVLFGYRAGALEGRGRGLL